MTDKANNIRETTENEVEMFSMKNITRFLTGFLIGVIIAYVIFICSMNTSTEEITANNNIQIEIQS
jgi:hypothetical protein